jgi:hypothetical protein
MKSMYYGIATLIISGMSMIIPNVAYAANTNYAAVGNMAGLVAGVLAGAFVTFKIHPFLGMMTLIGGLAAIAKLLS